MSRRTLVAALPAAALLGLAVPATSSGSAVALSKACYTQAAPGVYQPITGTITGGNPGFSFQIQGKSGAAANSTGTIDGAGNAGFSIPSFNIKGTKPSKGRKIALEVLEGPPGSPLALTGTANATVTNSSMNISLKRRAPFSRATWTISGLTPVFGPGTLYASYSRGKYRQGQPTPKIFKRIKLGRPTNACGYLRVKKVAPPRRRFETNTIWVHVGKTFDIQKSLAYSIETFRTFSR